MRDLQYSSHHISADDCHRDAAVAGIWMTRYENSRRLCILSSYYRQAILVEAVKVPPSNGIGAWPAVKRISSGPSARISIGFLVDLDDWIFVALL